MNKDNTINFNNQKFFIGIDVHLKQWTVTIRCNRVELRTFSMNPSPLDLHNHLLRNYPGGSYFSVYEAGFSGYWIHRSLLDLGINNIVVHSADVPTKHKEKDRKTDSIDSRKLVRELENNNLKGIYIPDDFHQQLRSLCRLRYKIVQNMTRVKNRIKSHLHFNGISIPSHSEKSRWSANFIKWLLTVEFDYEPGKDYLLICIEELKEHRERLLKVLRSLRKYSQTLKLSKDLTPLYSIPGIGFVTAITFYTELIDIERFPDMDHLASYVGLVPSISSSDETLKNCGLTCRRNKYLRHLIIESSWIAIRKDPVLLHKYNKLTKRMKKQDAIIRIAKKLLSRIRYVWKNHKEYVTGVIE